MVSWGGLGGLAPPGISVTRAWGVTEGALPPQESPLITRALPLWGGEAPPYLCLAPRGGSGGLGPPGNSVTRALPPQRPCLAPVPCPPFFFVRIFSSKFFSSVVGPSSVCRPSVVHPSVRRAGNLLRDAVTSSLSTPIDVNPRQQKHFI